MSRPEAPGLGPDGPVFAEPWQAEAFAVAHLLHEQGHFSWPEWTAALSAELQLPSAATDGSDYYEHWLNALTGLITAKGLAEPLQIAALSDAWTRAAHATPHGKPIRLENDPQWRDD